MTLKVEQLPHTGGDCFQVALGLATGLESAKIVHGLPIGRGPGNNGIRYWHAWVEVEVDDHLVVCLDFASGNKFALPADTYYKAGQLDEEHVWRFTSRQAVDMMLKYDTYGPWVDGWEEMEG